MVGVAGRDLKRWKLEWLGHRGQQLGVFGRGVGAHAEELAQCITREMGKPIKQARAEVTKAAALCDWYAEHGPAMLNPEPTLLENKQAGIEYRPLGVILAKMPWNVPSWQVLRGAVPILLAGYSYLLKH
ncbi:aldehyde dehydrogenase family protein, partial [Salmonella enterica]|uniref:aldehyde dehydrogenase family protein n=1 Tax=Salmonella enterica TaxID=28901 RepID=UPI00398C67A4